MKGRKSINNFVYLRPPGEESIEKIIESPLACGFLNLFCKEQHNNENLSFLMEVMRFRDVFRVDLQAWPNSYHENDRNFVENESRSWPSVKVNHCEVLEIMREIYDKFIKDDSPYEICISQEVRLRTMMRVQNVELFGPEVFTEATIEPIKTLKRDIFPRFISSEIYAHMKQRLTAVEPLPNASDLKLLAPTGPFLNDVGLEDMPETRAFSLKEVLECGLLYNEFLIYLRRAHSSENLLCYHMIQVYENLIRQELYEEAENEAWNIYRFFIASGSVYEICCDYMHKKAMLERISIPTLDLFKAIKRGIYVILKSNFETFQSTPAYGKLAKTVRMTIQTTEERPANRVTGHSNTSPNSSPYISRHK